MRARYMVGRQVHSIYTYTSHVLLLTCSVLRAVESSGPKHRADSGLQAQVTGGKLKLAVGCCTSRQVT